MVINTLWRFAPPSVYVCMGVCECQCAALNIVLFMSLHVARKSVHFGRREIQLAKISSHYLAKEIEHKYSIHPENEINRIYFCERQNLKNLNQLKMFVVVYLVDARAYTVIPKEFIYKLLEENVFNKGLNSNQNRLVYFSAELFDVLQNGVDAARGTYIPNFNLPVTQQFPPPDDLQETCYIARMKKFFGKMP